jgi:hypothetical protein
MMGDTNDAGKEQPVLRDVLREAMASEEDSDTLYRPAANEVVAPTSDAMPERPNQRKPPAGRFATIIEFIVPRPRRAR